jgi:proteic killer suppression protein
MSIDECNRIGYIFIMIKNFSHKGLEGFFYNDDKSGIQPKHAQKIADVLDRLEASNEIRDMNFPGSNLHQLSGKLKGFWSVKLSGNWRIIFKFSEGNAYDVDYIDYH